MKTVFFLYPSRLKGNVFRASIVFTFLLSVSDKNMIAYKNESSIKKLSHYETRIKSLSGF
ncbi:hypothetical protein A3D05_05770 [Candidatus Gottesmanbacteria bacterium RIFCSPHIGHO2_02_FULL_40_24]|uniref:Uncharacterized protein n=1 Tax=Candidatus Gottesmanbacteria bacterium RIFCSPHIGHO2_01_FULL_40_15 TaxID=1798376 RepID=A0A1F5Z744_9BACT|nr:MAG: hypothetical protein A2777_02405 [Candidatus Gottesmanbacteria bacterium RIFCSPHIGHO2_01_FULL_40_15]OGG16535.1 MAG: hypothetical protein A3D05_05770 [Candidatus Gottesmanbacteria bacterium RIFCSPHIGHO2_02_FULL_40_24]OGG22612.1 MAG: hypothetical protein A3B48_02250 [Candidatus Gottesmanbacteria bacterium RIFCSPLOWO2_01_FULL_40_10]OGG25648.1 MAG: hypothetical protein A3E42_04920 [Candidatus Gottesmanbacteria bacterium RIFCSPHIGHO2_12_FULL_40_13]OGG32650.1 MAG: hypothetical protein A3I80_0